MNKNIILRLHHVSLIVEDLENSLAFYDEVLGLKMDLSRPDLGYPGAWLTLPGEQQLHLLQLDNPDKDSLRPQHGGRDHHVAFQVKSIDDIEDSLIKLKMLYTKSKSGRKAIFSRDPDGNALEFIES